jgi:hypothetical protein
MAKTTAKFVLFNGCEDWHMEEVIQNFLASIEPMETPIVSVSSHSQGGRRCFAASISWMDEDSLEDTRAKKLAVMGDMKNRSAVGQKERIEYHKVLGEFPSPALRNG